MTSEQFDALKAWVEAKAVEIIVTRSGEDALTESICASELERTARALLVGGGCTSCTNFTMGRTCRVWKQDVPEDARAAGCDHYELDDIPY